jgi:hypothetical protein
MATTTATNSLLRIQLWLVIWSLSSFQLAKQQSNTAKGELVKKSMLRQ